MMLASGVRPRGKASSTGATGDRRAASGAFSSHVGRRRHIHRPFNLGFRGPHRGSRLAAKGRESMEAPVAPRTSPARFVRGVASKEQSHDSAAGRHCVGVVLGVPGALGDRTAVPGVRPAPTGIIVRSAQAYHSYVSTRPGAMGPRDGHPPSDRSVSSPGGCASSPAAARSYARTVTWADAASARPPEDTTAPAREGPVTRRRCRRVEAVARRRGPPLGSEGETASG